MATETSPQPPPEENNPTSTIFESAKIYDSSQILGQNAKPWVDYAIDQARVYQKTVQETLDSAIEASRSRISEILSTSSAHFDMTLYYLEDFKSEIRAYEDLAFSKIKEGVLVTASQPLLSGSIAAGLGIVLLKRPRSFLLRKTMRLFLSEETLLSRADAKVKELQKSIESLKAESAKLEKSAIHGEDELLRGRTKLRQAGKQIQGVIQSTYKIERRARGLKDILGELPRREASGFRSQVSNVVSEAKKERNVLTKVVTKISNYGISV